MIVSKQRQVKGLSEEGRRLRARAAVAQCAVEHCDAMLTVCSIMQQAAAPGAAGGPGEAPGPPSLLLQLKQQLESAGAAEGPRPRRLPLAWDPEAAAREAPSLDFSTRGMQQQIIEFTRFAAPYIARVRGGAPDAAEALLVLEAARAKGACYAALSACAGIKGTESLAPFGALVERLPAAQGDGGACSSGARDEGQAPQGEPEGEPEGEPGRGAPGGLGGGAVGGAAGPSEASPAHWDWALDQIELNDEQELLLLELTDMWRERVQRIERRREQLLLARGAEPPADDPAAGPGAAAAPWSLETEEELVSELEALQGHQLLNHVLTDLVMCASVLSAVQAAAFYTACLPFVAGPAAVSEALQRRLKRRQQQQQGHGQQQQQRQQQQRRQLWGSSDNTGQAPAGRGETLEPSSSAGLGQSTSARPLGGTATATATAAAAAGPAASPGVTDSYERVWKRLAERVIRGDDEEEDDGSDGGVGGVHSWPSGDESELRSAAATPYVDDDSETATSGFGSMG